MLDDFEMIVHKFPKDMYEMHIYPLGDPQVGSENFDEKLWQKWKDRVRKDPLSKVVIVGDMMNNALKGSRSNSYREKMQPADQKKWLKGELLEFQGKILGAVRGNHEERSVNAVDGCPLYDIMEYLGLEDLYRAGLAFLSISLGERASKDRQITYSMVLGHGASKNKTEKFSYSIEGMDIMVTGHIHRPESSFPARIVMDMQNKQVRTMPFKHVIVPSFDRFGGYVAKGMYLPQSSDVTPIIILSGRDKLVDVVWKQEKLG